MPAVASAACWRKAEGVVVAVGSVLDDKDEVEGLRERTSMRTRSRWAAKMPFMSGMYWVARELETLRMRIRDWRPASWELGSLGSLVGGAS